MADKKINGSLEITGKLNPNNSGYGFIIPDNSSLAEDKTIATADQVDLKADLSGNNTFTGANTFDASNSDNKPITIKGGWGSNVGTWEMYGNKTEFNIHRNGYTYTQLTIKDGALQTQTLKPNGVGTSYNIGGPNEVAHGVTYSWAYNNLYLKGNIYTDKNDNYGLTLPNTTSWTGNKEIATTDQVALKADKVGPLPICTSNNNNVINFIQDNNLDGKPFILNETVGDNAGYYYAYFKAVSGTLYTFELRSAQRNKRLYSYMTNLSGVSFSNMLGTTFEKNYELNDNKVTSLSSSSTDTQYPSAKLVYDQLALKADKVGPLPEFLVNTTDNVLEFIENNGVNGKPLILHLNIDVTGRACYYRGILINTSSRLSFMFEEVSTGYVYKGQIPGNTSSSTTFADIISSLYLRMYEDLGNKVTSLSSSSTDTQYPSAKCVYDAIPRFTPVEIDED